MTDPTVPTAAKTYRCADCGGEFEKCWPDEEAQTECVKNFGKRGDTPGMVKVCDDCYHAIMQGMNN